jgi:hypothetical protein
MGGDPRGVLLSDAPAFRTDPSKRRTSGLRTENVIDLSSDSSSSRHDDSGHLVDHGSDEGSGDDAGFGLATAEIPTLRMDDTLPSQDVSTKSKSRPSIQAAVLFGAGAKVNNAFSHGLCSTDDCCVTSKRLWKKSSQQLCWRQHPV